MCDLTTVEYQKDEIVWVKLSNLWWPGQVQDYDALPEEIKADFKKEPIAVVKFFQEETFEYVKNTNNIYRYNCLKKNEFIKKGLDMMRSTRVSTSNMQMFPVDIVTAEKLTNGDENILSRPEFQPPDDKEVGKSVYEDLFSSSPNTKKLKKDAGGGSGLLTSSVSGGSGGTRSVYSSSSRKDQFLKRKSLPNKLSHRTPVARHITHPRFNLNFTDPGQNYACKELIQESEPSISLPSGSAVANGGSGDASAPWFKCPDCSYECTRVNVMLLHYRAHSRKYDHKIKYPAGEKRKKKSLQSSSGNNGGGNSWKKIKLTNGELSVEGKSKLLKNDGKSNKRKSGAETASQRQPKEIEKSTLDFLEDWDDEDDEEETNVSGLLADVVPETPPQQERKMSATENTKDEEKAASCFDFEESDNEEKESTSTGKKKNGIGFRHFGKTDEKLDNAATMSSVGSSGSAANESRRRRSSSKLDLVDQVDALLSETKVPDIPDVICRSGGRGANCDLGEQGGDAITLAPPSENIAGFGTFTDLNESAIEFRNDIKSKVSSTPAPAKLSKQTLKTNYFKKVRQEIAEVAKFEEEDGVDHHDDEDDEDTVEEDGMETDITRGRREVETPIRVDGTKGAVEKSSDGRAASGSNVVTQVDVEEKSGDVAALNEDINKLGDDFKRNQTDSAKVVRENKLNPDSNVSVAQPIAQPTSDNDAPKVQSIAVTVIEKKSTSGNNTTPQKIPLPSAKANIDESKPIPVVSSPGSKTEKTTDSAQLENIVRIGNQNIHIPIRRPSKSGGSGTPVGVPLSKTADPKERSIGNRKTEDDNLSEMMLVEEVNFTESGRASVTIGGSDKKKVNYVRESTTKVGFSKSQQQSSVEATGTVVQIHLATGDHSKKSIVLEKCTPEKKVIKPMPTIIPIDNSGKSKSKSIQIPSDSPAPSSDEKFYVLPNNQKIIKVPPTSATNSNLKSPVRSTTTTGASPLVKKKLILTGSDGGKIYLTDPQSASGVPGELSTTRKLTIPSNSSGSSTSKFMATKKEVKSFLTQPIILSSTSPAKSHSSVSSTAASSSSIVYVQPTKVPLSNTKVIKSSDKIPLITMKSTQKKITMPSTVLNRISSPAPSSLKSSKSDIDLMSASTTKIIVDTSGHIAKAEYVKPVPTVGSTLTQLPTSPVAAATTPLTTSVPTTALTSSKVSNVLQNKIKTIAKSNAARASETGKSPNNSNSSSSNQSSNSVVINQSTLPNILQQRKNSNQPRGQPPAIITEPRIIETALSETSGGDSSKRNSHSSSSEVLSDLAGIPNVSSNESIVYYIHNNQSQQILFNNVPADAETIYLDEEAAAGLSNFYLTVDDEGNILNIVDNPNNVSGGGPAVIPALQTAPTNPPPSNDILAKALADTQVLQAECAAGAGPLTDPFTAAVPIINNTYETSLTLNKAPIMATSEAPSQVQSSACTSTAAATTFFAASTAAAPSCAVTPAAIVGNIVGTGGPLMTIKPSESENIVRIASPEIGYAPSDIVPT